MEKQKLIELLRKAYLSGVMEKELSDKMQGFKHDFESMATHYAEIEVNNGVLDDVSNRRKLLIDFIEVYAKTTDVDDESFVDWFLRVKDN